MDPQCPPGYTPFVWLFDLQTFIAKPKGPDNILGRKHYYTVPGARDPLYLEKALQKVESAFAPILRNKIGAKLPLTSLEKVHVLAFAATMKARTKVQLDHLSTQFARILEIGRDLEARTAQMSPEERKKLVVPTILPNAGPRLGGPRLGLEQVEKMVDSPAHVFIRPMMVGLLREFGRMAFSIACTDDPVGFITSDAPCVFFDPLNSVSPDITSPELYVQLPLSPERCLVLTRDPAIHDCYSDVSGDAMAAINRFTCTFAGESLVSRSATLGSCASPTASG
jgi:hypothetical protein